MKNVKHILIIGGEIPTTSQLEELDNIIEDLKIETYVANDGIGSYEFWGFMGCDNGVDYLSINQCQDLELTIIFKTQLNEDIETYIKEEIIGNLYAKKHVSIENKFEEIGLEADFKLVPLMNLGSKTFATIANITSSLPIKHIATLTLTWDNDQ